MTIALDATYSVGDLLSGVGLYSREILFGLAAAHPDVRFDFCYRGRRFFRAGELPPNAHSPIEHSWFLGQVTFQHGSASQSPVCSEHS